MDVRYDVTALNPSADSSADGTASCTRCGADHQARESWTVTYTDQHGRSVTMAVCGSCSRQLRPVTNRRERFRAHHPALRAHRRAAGQRHHDEDT